MTFDMTEKIHIKTLSELFELMDKHNGPQSLLKNKNIFFDQNKMYEFYKNLNKEYNNEYDPYYIVFYGLYRPNSKTQIFIEKCLIRMDEFK